MFYRDEKKEKVFPCSDFSIVTIFFFWHLSDVENKNNLMKELVRELRNKMTVLQPRGVFAINLNFFFLLSLLGKVKSSSSKSQALINKRENFFEDKS